MLGPGIAAYLVVSVVLFAIGAFGVLARRSPLIVLLALEIMLNAGNLALIAFARQAGTEDGQIFALAVMVVAASEAVVGLGFIVAMSRLRADLDQVTADGYAVAVDELEVGLTAAAAPIRSAHGDIIASMSVSGPTYRLSGEKLETTIPLLVAAATEVSHRLGWGQRS